MATRAGFYLLHAFPLLLIPAALWLLAKPSFAGEMEQMQQEQERRTARHFGKND